MDSIERTSVLSSIEATLRMLENWASEANGQDLKWILRVSVDPELSSKSEVGFEIWRGVDLLNADEIGFRDFNGVLQGCGDIVALLEISLKQRTQ